MKKMELVSGVPISSDIKAWYMEDDNSFQANPNHNPYLPHHKTPNEPCALDSLKQLGVLHWKLSGNEEDRDLDTLRTNRGYNYKDVIEISPKMFMSKDKPNEEEAEQAFKAKLRVFYEEHIHADEEIRYFLDGTGYFDVRDLNDRWIRIECGKGDLLILPEGIYHRFTVDTKQHAKVLRLFVGEPIWTPYNRPQEDHASRKKYVDSFSRPHGTAM